MGTKRTDIYQSPLEGRYPSKEMLKLFSADTKFSTWRKLWVALAEVEKDLGLKQISDEQIEEMKSHISDINYDVAEAREKVVRHDVMSHVYAYGQQCPKAAGIIHLGATSCYVTDNTDLLLIKEALRLIETKLLGAMHNIANFAEKNADVPTLAFTHFQPASPTTVGKRACLWLQDLYENYLDVVELEERIKFLGSRGATGSQETFKELFNNDYDKVSKIDGMLAEKFGFNSVYPVSGQTYPRTLDTKVLDCLKHICESLHKMGSDIRLLQHKKEIEEPFEKKKIGSSAMAYKRNPMRSERMCSLSREVLGMSVNASTTAMTQWLERTLDDSAGRRIHLPEAFLTTDAILILATNIMDGMVVYPKVIQKHLDEELPFMATEPILMEAVKRGGNRQELHEKIRVYSMEAGRHVKEEGKDNNLIYLMAQDDAFNMTEEEMKEVLNPRKLCGYAPEQVKEFLESNIFPILKENEEALKNINSTVEV